MHYLSHPLADIFPMMNEEEYQSLKEDIRKNGLIEPVWLYEDKILDGRNRYKACVELEIEPEFYSFDDKESSPLDFVMSLNLSRRHLTSSQKATVALEALPFFEEEAKKRQILGAIATNTGKEKIPEASRQARDDAAQLIGVNSHYVSDAKAIKESSPELFEKIRQGEKTISEVKKELKTIEKQKRKANIPEFPDSSDRYQIYHDSFIDTKIEHNSIDVIITDPPYPKEFLYLYDQLSVFASLVLKKGGSLICMVGQSYLPEIMQSLNIGLNYYWTGCYLTPGQSPNLWHKRVNTQWKPILWFVKGEYKGDCINDIFRSDRNDKNYHMWGQSEAGMADLIEKFSDPGQLILDPFLGGGTTGSVALKMNRKFIGIDIDEEAIKTSKERLHNAQYGS